MKIVALVVIGFLVEACSSSCEIETCGNGKKFQSCVEGKDLVIRDTNGLEFSRCKTAYGSTMITGDANDCAYKHSVSKDAFCDSGPSTDTNNTNNSSTGATGSTGSTGSATGTSYCYKTPDNSVCECSNTVDGSNFAGWTKVTSCSATVGLVSPLCCVTKDSSSLATYCQCTSQPKACREDGDVCSCPLANASGDLSQVRASCMPTGGRICCLSESYCKCGDEQYSGAGCIGFGGLNEDTTQVASCTAPSKAIDWCSSLDERTSCDGLTWAP